MSRQRGPRRGAGALYTTEAGASLATGLPGCKCHQDAGLGSAAVAAQGRRVRLITAASQPAALCLCLLLAVVVADATLPDCPLIYASEGCAAAMRGGDGRW